MKKIMLCTHVMASGGAETLAKDYAIELHKRGYDVTVLVRRDAPEMPNQKALRENGIRVIPVFRQQRKQQNFLLGTFQRKIQFLYEPFKIRKIISQIKPDVIHVHLRLMQCFFFSYDLLKKTKIFYTSHNETSVVFENSTFTGKREVLTIKLFLKKRNLRIIALHNRMADEINRLFGVKNTVVVNNPIDLDRFFDVKVNKTSEKNLLGIPEKSFVIGNVGRFNQQKNHSFLVEVFSEVASKREDAFLLMIGSGELIQEVRDLLKKKHLENRYLILSDRKDIPELLSVMDVFCFPSLFEGFPLAVLEAQAVRLPCFISSRVPEEIMLTEHIWRLNLEEGAKVWADNILDPNKELFRPTHSLEEFDISNVIDKLETVYFGNV